MMTAKRSCRSPRERERTGGEAWQRADGYEREAACFPGTSDARSGCGIDVVVGILADLKKSDAEGVVYFKEQFGILNQFLSGAGLRTTEPEELDEVCRAELHRESRGGHGRR